MIDGNASRQYRDTKSWPDQDFANIASGGKPKKMPGTEDHPDKAAADADGAGHGLPPSAGLRVGLLGGSFNPAHEGHVHISHAALRRLRLDQVWWLVSPQNPLKAESGMAPQDDRIAGARAICRKQRGIFVTGVESRLATRYTADTLAALRGLCPRTKFVWLMGADNLSQIDQWERWTEIFDTIPVAILDRASYSSMALASAAARRYRRHRLPEGDAPRLADQPPPAWVFLRIKLHPASASEIRARGNST